MGQSHTRMSESEEDRALFKTDSLSAKEADLQRYLPAAIYTLLLLMGLLALAATILSITNYQRSMESVGGLSLEFTKLQIIDDDNPRAQLQFKLYNHAPMSVGIERYSFTLYANGERIGGSASTYRGTDPNVDQKEYEEATTIEQVISPDGHLDLDFTLYIYPAQMEIVREAQRAGPITWTVNAGFHVKSLYSRSIESIGLQATLEQETK